MGRFTAELLARDEEFELVASFGRDEPWEWNRSDGGGPLLGIDFTRAGLGFRHGMALLEAGIRPVIGTSGVSEQEVSALDRRARELRLGGLVVPNLSLGAWLLQRAACDAAAHLQRVEILELHHARKADAPSSTALALARRLAAVLARHHAPTQEIPIHSIRLPGLYAHHEILLGGEGEVLRLRHDMLSPEGFGTGLRLALRRARALEGIEHGLDGAFAALSAAALCFDPEQK
jgi:4-hydroxy-tetrahydrodipicolinate reductase